MPPRYQQPPPQYQPSPAPAPPPSRPPEPPREEKESQIQAPAWLAVSRGTAFFLGIYTLIGVFGELRHPGFDASIWWIDLRPLSVPATRGVLAFSSVLLIGFAARPWMSAWRKRITFLVVFALFVAALWNALTFYTLWKSGQIVAGFPIPFSLHIAAALAVIVAGLVTHSNYSDRTIRDWFIAWVTVAACGVAFPLAQMFCFGTTDYRRPADVAVVFGCGVRDDGMPTSALADRIRTGCELYKAGLVKKLIFSGGPDDVAGSEPEVMKKEAIEQGVPEKDILLDARGFDTQATVDNTTILIHDLHANKVLAVSHFYHLPRIKLAYHRAGVEVYTVPAPQQRILHGLPKYQAREILALWFYYLRPLLDANG